METTFTYLPGYHIDYKGMGFDSLLELRYAISIEDDFAFMREGIKIFYDPATAKSTNYLREGIHRYTPDFLIRNWQTGRAYLVEIKPLAYDDFNALALLQTVCSHYIKVNNYDWEYIIIFENEITLSLAKQERYDAVLANKILYRKYYGYYSLDLRKLHGQPVRKQLPPHLSWDEYLLYIKRNKLPAQARF